MKSLSMLPFLAACLLGSAAGAGQALEEELGRSEVRVRSAAYPLVAGRTVEQAALVQRLEQNGYVRVPARPSEPGQFFFGHDVFWVWRRAHRLGGVDYAASLIGLELRRTDGMILGTRSIRGTTHALDRPGALWLEPEVISESLLGDRAERVPLRLDDLPERVWRPVLAAEDARFFEHGGLDSRALARAALANARAGKVTQGGSTITQQLVKNRDLSPKRTLGRKASEAVRALMLESEYTKREILEAYLNQVYLGHVDGLALHGFGAAARAYFSKPAASLSLVEAATLAAMIQGPNRLNPERHPERLRERRDWVLGRMEELGWATAAELGVARARGIALRPTAPRAPAARQFVSWVAERVEGEFPDRLDRGRGVVVETSLDPFLQRIAERVVRERLAALRRDHRELRDGSLSAALVALDGDSGAVLAWVGGDPGDPGSRFDRARAARRQPGSAVKPLLLLEAFDRCAGQEQPLHPATRVLDRPLSVPLDDGVWRPENFDRRFRDIVDVRRALRESINVPFVRITLGCGLEASGERLRTLGLEVPEVPPPSLALGALETTVLELARAYTVFATPGYVVEPYPYSRVELPGGRPLLVERPGRRRVARPASAWLVRDLMRDAVREGTGQVARIEELDVAGKTGTSSATRDAWFVGHAGSIVTAVWVGRDDGAPLGLTGSRGAGPVWAGFMREAVPARPPASLERPRGVVERRVDPASGLLVRERNPRGRPEVFRRSVLPKHKRFWRRDRPAPVLH
jgi:penicillin-binding protein 1B